MAIKLKSPVNKETRRPKACMRLTQKETRGEGEAGRSILKTKMWGDLIMNSKRDRTRGRELGGNQNPRKRTSGKGGYDPLCGMLTKRQ